MAYQVTKDSIIDGETHQGAHLMKTMYACRTRIDMQGIDSTVVHHFKDVRVPTDEEYWRLT